MGAGASTVGQNNSNGVESGAKVVKETVRQVNNVVDATKDSDIYADTNAHLDKYIHEVGSAVGTHSQGGVRSILESVRGLMTSKQLDIAVSDIKDLLPTLQGDAIFAGVAACLHTAAEMSGPVIQGIGGALLLLGSHLPYIAVAAGAIGAVVYTFRLSKDMDENVKNVTLWMTSVRDWLMLVAGKISASGAASTIPLFEGLQEAMMTICTQMEKWKDKWRITKMLGSATFERDFTRVKTSVLELKTALRDYLDEETQIRQENQLNAISSMHLQTHEKLQSIDDQLAQIRAMLDNQTLLQKEKDEADKVKKEHVSKTEVKEEVERIFQNIQTAAGVSENSPVVFRDFVFVFETFFYGGSDMPSEQRRGLSIAVDRDQTNLVTKAAWIKFYQQWTESNLEIEHYLNKIAEENPTLLKITKDRAKLLADVTISKAREKLSAYGIENIDDAKRKVDEMKNMIEGQAKKKISDGIDHLVGGKINRQKQSEVREGV